jgi:hypothetical protein
MWDFNWGVFWAVVAYGALKFGVKRALGLYGARVKQARHKPHAELGHKPFHNEPERKSFIP